MLRYIVSRIITGLFMLLALSVLVFIMLRLTPGDPIDAYINPTIPISEEDLAALRERLGLDQPLPIQHFAWLAAALSGDFGYSIQRGGVPVLPLVLSRVGPTVLLMFTAMLIAIVAGIFAGIVSAIRKNRAADVGLSILSFLGVSSPAFLTGLLGLYAFSVVLRWFPSGGMLTPGQPYSTLDVLYHLILLATLLSIAQGALIMRYMRSSLLEVLSQDYMRTALLPVITLIGSTIGGAIGGAIFIESVFNWPGMGLLMITAVTSRDYSVIMCATLLIGASVILINLLTDIAYAAVDPRIRNA